MRNPSFWIELLMRSAVLLSAALSLRHFATRATARFRHGILLCGLLGLALFPAAVVILPPIPLSLRNSLDSSRATVTAEERSMIVPSRAGAESSVNWALAIWLTGVFAALAPLIPGSLLSHRITRRARPLADTEWLTLLDEICLQRGMIHQPQVLVSDQLRAPLTCGVLRPRIVLPSDWSAWKLSRRRAVLLHELAHVQRHDVAIQFGVHILTALWWFQPLVWVARRTLRLESEMACDAEALSFGLRPSQYAEDLLTFAQASREESQWSSVALSMARPNDLEARLISILKARPAIRSQARLWGSGFAITAIAIGASSMTPISSQTLYEQGGSTMKRTLVSALLTSAGLSAATVSGSVFDPNGAAILNAKIQLYNPDTGAKLEAISDGEGKFSIDAESAGEYILRIDKAGYDSVLRAFDLQADTKIERGLMMSVGKASRDVDNGAKLASPEPGQTSSPDRVRIGGIVAQSNLSYKKQPVYPQAAKDAHVQGKVELETVISREGVPTEIRVTSSPSDDLSQSALEAVRQWRYKPTLLNGNPVEVVTEVLVNYTLSQ